MAFVEAMDAWLAWASLVFCHPVSIFLQLKGCLVYLVLAAGWAYNSVVRARELHRIRAAEAAGNALAFLYPNVDDLEHSAQAKLLRVSVVMPLKGFGEHNLSNWRSQVLSMYGGPLEFLFVVESKEDPACEVILQLMRDLKGEVDAKLLVAGYSTTCSQKIHNQLAGVDAMHKDSKYVLFLDDDVQLCPGSIGALVAHMIEHPEIFVLTGYPFDLPSGSISSYCIYEYHLPCSIGFGFGRTFFLWGGCMMMHAEDFRTDRYGMVTGLREGGYSDDMTLAAVAGANQRVISSPERAIFFHPLAKDLSFSRYWNYLQKQTIVLETYNTTYNYWMNRGLFFLHCWASWSFVFPYLTSCVHLLVAMRMLMGASAELYSSWTTGLWLTGCIATATLIELSSMRHLSTVVIDLINALSPGKDPVSISSYNYVKVFVAGIVGNFLYPVSAVYSHVFQHIDWAGVQYWLGNGNICQIQRGSRRWRVVESSKSGWSTEEIHGQFPNKSTVWTLLSDLLMNQSCKLKNS
ncbi:uncharacterized protein [Physcomitrium patens]|uniref:ceramide glucosyltransferase n=1 Tax=Physcomitrium patens TaxID=3218 RepID=A0A2K1J7N2_PHYPA|nr:uncharacterized protein LOC112293937 isoform X1 [Physcomitrium patens]PNR37533.1 hypothetical protein PHYPA_020642 [Physcomitrium patens]|eukprot:XP_024399720.1 uncharacterized protein LOC112293937 isoform X1 [Physcomitrella patens]